MSGISTFFVLVINVQIIFMLNSCQQQTTCHECIKDPSVCSWCAMNEFNGTRCKPRNSYSDSWCPTLLQNPKGSKAVNASDNLNFSSVPGNVIQIKPQRYKLKLRPGEPLNFNFSFYAVKDYPVDLYFLLDASNTMSKIKTQTAKQSNKIYEAMKQMTNDVQIGMGTFIDKNVLPIVKVIDSEKTYSFKHRLTLTKDIEQFQKIVSDTPSGSNRDLQEGGLDALAQVIVCNETIGWRKESRKIVLFITDGQYHAAGDGKFAGIFQPYDGNCYMSNNTYTKEAEMDYPSVGIINKLALQRDIIILFVVDDGQEIVYRELSSVISGSKLATYHKEKLEKSDTIVQILKNIYEEISMKIKFKVMKRFGGSTPIQISFNPDCTKSENSIDCSVSKGKEQQFKGTITLREYDGTDNTILDIAIEGIHEKLTLDIDVIKDCDCEKPEQSVVSKDCFGELLQCGICKCGKERYGEKCACVVKNKGNTYNDNSTCIAPGSDAECSGQGSCYCGTCKCREGYQGKYCECNMNNCPKGIDNKAICNDHGSCDCQKCNCKPGWSGNACECSNSVDGCKAADNKICNNRGTCKCSSCKCNSIAKWDARKSQDSICNIAPCADCHDLQCRVLDSCALCHWKGDECDCDEQIAISTIDKLNEVYLNSSLWNVCPDIRVDVGCYTSYVYRYMDNTYGLEILVQKDKNCVENYLLFGGMFSLTMIFIGIATLVAYKLLTDARDRREHDKFVEQHKEDLSDICSNPLYEMPSTTFSNPAFRKPSVDFQ